MDSKELVRRELNRADLLEALSSLIPSDGVLDPIAGLRLSRASQQTERIYGVTKPSLCIIAQGSKEVQLGQNLYKYDAQNYFLATVELPAVARVAEAHPLKPYLALRLELEPSLVASVLFDSGLISHQEKKQAKATVVSPLGDDLLDAVVRLIKLVKSPIEAAVLMPLVKREIIFHLLAGEQGSRLRHVIALSGQGERMAQAIETLRKNFTQPIKIDSLAEEMGMSPSSFFHHFKQVTDMSPLQFQKELRLQEARRLMLSDSLDAAGAALRVGYDNASHFSRDYKRLFGDPPVKDVSRLRRMVAAD